jgi:AcrR family transcriptional regulator
MPAIRFGTIWTLLPTDTPEKPLRKDAERNRRRILDAARQLFATRGLGVTLNDIAHHAGVGVGTVYRHFPDKDQLIEGLFEERFEEIVALMQDAAADPDPWHGLVSFLERTSELQITDRGLTELVTDPSRGLERIGRFRNRLQPMVHELVRHAQDTGQLRADISPQDVPIVQLMTATVIDASRDIEPELWRRYLSITIRGMSARPDEQPPLACAAPELDQVDRLMTRRTPPRH